jgi:hypothetical protein
MDSTLFILELNELESTLDALIDLQNQP